MENFMKTIMKKFTSAVASLGILILGAYACNETNVSQPSSEKGGNMEEESTTEDIQPYKAHLYYFMDFKDEDGIWITNTDNRFFIKKKNDSITKIGVKVNPNGFGEECNLPRFGKNHRKHLFNHKTMDLNIYIPYNPGEWLEDRCIEILNSEFKNNYYWITLSSKNLRITDPQPIPPSEDPMWKNKKEIIPSDTCFIPAKVYY